MKTGNYFKDEYGFYYFFPADEANVVYIAGANSPEPWRRLAVGDYRFDGHKFTQETFDHLRESAVNVGTFNID